MLLSEVPAYIRANLNKNLTIKFLSRACFSNPTSFKLRFKAAFGISFGQYVLAEKMKAAAKMLASGKYNKVEEVGTEIGYVNMSQFAEQFRRSFGYLPFSILVKPVKDRDVKDFDKVLTITSLAHRINQCPETLKTDFENHFGVPLITLLQIPLHQ